MGAGTPPYLLLCLLALYMNACAAQAATIVVTPTEVTPTSLTPRGGTANEPIRKQAQHSWPASVRVVGSVHEAREAVRTILAAQPSSHVDVQLLPGMHHVGNTSLQLNAKDGAAAGGSVTWKSADASNPASFGAPIRVTGWKPHATLKDAYTAPLPPNVSAGSVLRQLWVNGIRADRPRVYGTGIQQGDNKMGRCLNLTNATNTKMYPEGSQYDFSFEKNVDPSKWSNPQDVEFVYTGCDSINCWVEPRCTVQEVSGNLVSLQQHDNHSCYHRLYHWDHCLNWNDGHDGLGKKPRNPTTIENVATNFSYPGQFYYDRAAATISYVVRPGESLHTLEATATTATQQELLVVNGTQNLRWEGVSFEYATWLGASGPRGYVDTQSAYLCQDGEPPVNVHVWNATNVSFVGCLFQHLGGVYAIGAHNASQSIVVSNCTFTDCSGGAVKLGNAGERGAPAPDPALDPALQDRGYLVSDNYIHDMPVEYSGANPIFIAYTADATLSYNTIEHSSYSAICAGWGWGMGSYMRGIEIVHNKINKPMQPNERGQLEDGGCVYTNTPCPNCSVSHNFFSGDPTVYGCIYHDGGSGLWNDHFNVFNHIETSAVFAHGSSSHTTVVDMWLNDTHNPALEGDTNRDVRDADGNCINATMNFSRTEHGDDLFRIYTGPWSTWPDAAQAIIDRAGRRSVIPPPVVPLLSPPVTPAQSHPHDCAAPPAPPPSPPPPPGPPAPPPPPPPASFAAGKCVKGRVSQQWSLSPGVAPPWDGKPTNVISAMHGKPGQPSIMCWEIAECYDGGGINCKNGCKALPKPGTGCPDHCPPKGSVCDYNGMFRINENGTITTGMDLSCVTITEAPSAGSPVMTSSCTGKANQIFKLVPVDAGLVAGNNDDAGTAFYTIQQGDLCIDNSFQP